MITIGRAFTWTGIAFLLATVRATAAVNPAAAPTAPMVMLSDQAAPACGGNAYGTQLFREAVLIAAHSELGLGIRDAGLGESVDSGGASGVCLLRLVEADVPAQRSLSLRLQWLGHRQVKTIWRAQAPYGVVPWWRWEPVLTALAAARISALRQALLRAGLPNRLAAGPGAAIPPAVAGRLGKMNFVAQWEALRQIDQAIQRQGLSASALSLLARGYANLGLLTDQLFTSYRDTYKARAMLYAALLAQKYPRDPAVPWTRAYVDALVGLPRSAQRQIRLARAGARSAGMKPAWADTIAAYTSLDTMALAKTARRGGPEAGLAAVLAAMSLEGADSFGGIPRYQEKIAFRALRATHSLCLLEILENHMGVVLGHQLAALANRMLAYSLGTRLHHMQNLPQGVRKLLAQSRLAQGYYSPGALHRLVQTLAAAGRAGKDRGCPSWQALAALAQSSAVFNCERKLEFLRFSLCAGYAPIRADLQHIRPLVGQDPWWPLLQCFGVPKDTPTGRARLAALLSSLKVYAPTDTVLPALRVAWGVQAPHAAAAGIKSEIAFPLFHQASGDESTLSDEVEQDFMYMPADMEPVAADVLHLNPLDPNAIANAIWYSGQDPALYQQYLKVWTKAAPDSLPVTMALAWGYSQSSNPQFQKRAEPFLKRLGAIHAGSWVLTTLAGLYLRQGRGQAYVATMLRAIHTASDAVAAANYSATLANYLMDRGHYRRAESITAPAAKTWACAPMCSLARCDSALGRFATAEQWIRRASQRYPWQQACEWYFWCAMEHRGNTAAAAAFASQNVVKLDNASRYTAGAFAYLTGHPRSAIRAYRAAAQVEPSARAWNLVEAALIADGIRQEALRDRLLAQAHQSPGPSNEPCAQLAGLFQQALLAGRSLDLGQAAQLQTRASLRWRINLGYLIGRFLQLRGERARAIPYLRQGAEFSAFLASDRVAAIVALRQMGIFFDPNRPEYLTTTVERWIDQGRYDRARRMIDPALGAASSAPLLAAARCAAAVGQWAAAEALVRQASERFPEKWACAWYFWCAVERHGDLAAARTFALRNLGGLKKGWQFMAGAFDALIGRPRRAIEAYRSAARVGAAMRGLDLLAAALVADSLHNSALRDDLLSRASACRGPANAAAVQLARLLQQALRTKGKLNLAAVDKLENRSRRLWAPNLYYLVGQFLERRGDRVDAIRYYRYAAEHYWFYSVSRIQAIMALRRLGVAFNPNQPIPASGS